MPPRTPLRTPLRAWRCPQCRSFATTPRQAAIGPEHPRYIEVPEPPQQSAPYRPFIKGRLPVPRDIFAGAQGKDRADDEEITKATKRREHEPQHPKGSRDEWKQKMSEVRRRNLREGLKSLRTRKDTTERHLNERTARRQAERDELVHRPEREDERLTAPSHGLDLEKLLKGPLEDPTREARLAHKRQNVELHASAKQAERLDNLHTLYMRARNFIVTPQQLDAAVDEAFGTAEQPVTWANPHQPSMWSYGKPDSVQDMLNRANRTGGRQAMDGAEGYSNVHKERVRRIAEALTGGKMEESASR